MTKINKNQGGSYVVENGKAKKVEGTKEPKTSAPRDAQGNRLDQPKAPAETTSTPAVKSSNKGAKK